MNPCCSPGGACTGACRDGSFTISTKGHCIVHGEWWGSGCPGCFTFQPLDIQPLELAPLPSPALSINILESPPLGFRLVSDEKLRRLGELVDELVALAVELAPDG